MLLNYEVNQRLTKRLQVRDFFSDTLGMTGQLLDDVVKGVTKDDGTLLTFMRKVAQLEFLFVADHGGNGSAMRIPLKIEFSHCDAWVH